MDVYLQFGYGMMGHCRDLIEEWGGGTVVLSPRDLSPEQLVRLANDVSDLGGSALIDPQFYLPHADHERLRSHDYWPSSYDTGTFWDSPRLEELVRELHSVCLQAGARAFVVPGILASQIGDDWIAVQEIVLSEARAQVGELPVISTIALSDEAARSNEQIGLLMDKSESWDLDAVYLVWERPRGLYLADDPTWQANLLDVIGGFRLRDVEVIVGYSNQQMLVAAAAGANAICSGTWMNVRSFPPEKFSQDYNDEIRRRATWYYGPGLLSEYKIPYLDIAQTMGLLDLMRPSEEMYGVDVRPLFSGAQPSSVDFGERAAFQHYLRCLRAQSHSLTRASFDETLEACYSILDEAEQSLDQMNAARIAGQLRDFSDVIPAARSALAVLAQTRGPLLRRTWPEM